MKEKILFYSFVVIVCFFIAVAILQFISIGAQDYLFMILGAIIILIIGLIFLVPFVYEGKPPFSGKLEKPLTKAYDIKRQ